MVCLMKVTATKTLAHLMAAEIAAVALLTKIRSEMAEVKAKPDSIHWGHVGSAADLSDRLEKIVNND